MTARALPPADRSRPGDGLVRAGAIGFLVGLVALAATVTTGLLAGGGSPQALVLAAEVLMPAGLGTALAGMLRAARTGRRSSTPTGTATPPPS